MTKGYPIGLSLQTNRMAESSLIGAAYSIRQLWQIRRRG
jgi:Asp-tRNA(Asn)/Glu-tRNA(Gln) amidotransferase A subunit family amidase